MRRALPKKSQMHFEASVGPTVRESWGKIRRLGKVGEFYISKSGEKKRVLESHGKAKYRGAKVNKDAEKILNCFTQTAYNSSKFFFLFTSLADCLYLNFLIFSPLLFQCD